MNQQSKPGKQIISKLEYGINLGRKIALALFGLAVLLVGGACTMCFSILNDPLEHHDGTKDGMSYLTCVVIPLVGTLAMLYFGGRAVKEAKEMDAGVPLTRANSAHLPAADSLVRASAEPERKQADVLLRATLQVPETPPEEMVRASIGPRESSD